MLEVIVRLIACFVAFLLTQVLITNVAIAIGMAAIFALKSPDIELLGITPVMSNYDLNYEMV